MKTKPYFPYKKLFDQKSHSSAVKSPRNMLQNDDGISGQPNPMERIKNPKAKERFGMPVNINVAKHKKKNISAVKLKPISKEELEHVFEKYKTIANKGFPGNFKLNPQKKGFNQTSDLKI